MAVCIISLCTLEHQYGRGQTVMRGDPEHAAAVAGSKASNALVAIVAGQVRTHVGPVALPLRSVRSTVRKHVEFSHAVRMRRTKPKEQRFVGLCAGWRARRAAPQPPPPRQVAVKPRPSRRVCVCVFLLWGVGRCACEEQRGGREEAERRQK